MKARRESHGRSHALEVDPDLVDRLLELYCDWRTECVAVRSSYEQFSSAPASERDFAFAAYSAALDREGSAAERYAAQLELIVSTGTGDTPDPPKRTRIRRER
jgi:hypothetical protein